MFGGRTTGIYLVFWFGEDWRPSPKRADRRIAVTTQELASLLAEDIAARADTLEALVFDVSRPANICPSDAAGEE